MPINTLGPRSCQEKSGDDRNGNVWSYCETANRALTGAMAFAAFVAGIAVLIAGSSLTEKLPFILLLTVVVASMLWSSKRVTKVVVSRGDATIRKDERSLIFSRSRTYSLRDFSAIEVTENVRAGEEGYLMADYSLVFRGTGKSLPVLSTSDREEAKRLQQELRSYLEREPEGASSPGGR